MSAQPLGKQQNFGGQEVPVQTTEKLEGELQKYGAGQTVRDDSSDLPHNIGEHNRLPAFRAGLQPELEGAQPVDSKTS